MVSVPVNRRRSRAGCFAPLEARVTLLLGGPWDTVLPRELGRAWRRSWQPLL